MATKNYPLICLCIALPALLNCSGGTDAAKFRQYYNQGEKLYERHCSNCHQKDGTGLGRVYPPLAASDYMQNNFEGVICLIRYGKQGELVVNGQDFNMRMPAIPLLTDLEIGQIATYIYNSWGSERGIIDVNSASEILAKCDEGR